MEAEVVPPRPLPPEPSPPPPPAPRPPEPSPPSLFLLHFFDDDAAVTVSHGQMQMEQPSLILHMLVSSLSAFAMLILACGLRAQRSIVRHRPRPAVAEATPVLQVYGTIPSHEDVEEGSEAQIADSVVHDTITTSDDADASHSSSTIELEIIATTGWSPRSRLSATVSAQPIPASVPIVIAERVGEAVLTANPLDVADNPPARVEEVSVVESIRGDMDSANAVNNSL